MMNHGQVVAQVVSALLASGARRATKYLSQTETVKASRPVYRRTGKFDRRQVAIVVSIGKPNYEEREFIGRCTRAGEPFPIKRVQLKFSPRSHAMAKRQPMPMKPMPHKGKTPKKPC